MDIKECWDYAVSGIIALINNVTEIQSLKLELEKRSKTDSLTGLLNKQETETAIKLAAKISDKARHLFAGEPLERHVSLSIGIAAFPEHGKKFEDLYRSADNALYFVKEHGRDFYKLYSPELKSLHN